MKNNLQLLVDKLQTLHDTAMTFETPRSFFLSLFEYIDVFDKDQRLEQVSKKIWELKAQDYAKSKEYEAKALKEMRLVFKKIKDHIQKTGINNPFITDLLNSFEAYERDDGSIRSSDGPIAGRHRCLVRILIYLIDRPEEVHKEFSRGLGETNTERQVIYWNFSPDYNAWDKEQRYIERMQLTKVWYSWDKFALFYTLYKDYEKWRQKELDSKKYLSVMGLDDLFRELQDTMSYKRDPKRYLREFDVPTYKMHLQRIHLFAKEVLFGDGATNIVTFLPGQTVQYENKIVYFDMGDGTTDSIDLSNSPELRKAFETFWDLRKRKFGEKSFSPEEVIANFKKLFPDDDIDRQKFSKLVSNLKRTKINNKPNLRDRFILEFNKKSKKWDFDLH